MNTSPILGVLSARNLVRTWITKKPFLVGELEVSWFVAFLLVCFVCTCRECAHVGIDERAYFFVAALDLSDGQTDRLN
jgi:hypothetical protein